MVIGGKFDGLFSLGVRRGFAVGSLVVRWSVAEETAAARLRLAAAAMVGRWRRAGGSIVAR